MTNSISAPPTDEQIDNFIDGVPYIVSKHSEAWELNEVRMYLAAAIEKAKREERARIAQEVEELPVTRTQTLASGFDSVPKAGVLHVIADWDDDAPVEPPRKCGRDVGSKPYWMGEGQYDPCPCLLDKGHDGECKCVHTIGDEDAKD